MLLKLIVTKLSRSSRLCSCHRPTACPISWIALPLPQPGPSLINCSPPRFPTRDEQPPSSIFTLGVQLIPSYMECQMSFEVSPRCTMCRKPKAASAGVALLFWFGIFTFAEHELPSNRDHQRLLDSTPRCTMCSRSTCVAS